MKEYILFEQISDEFFSTDYHVIKYFKDSNRTVLHRDNYKPAILWSDGDKCYYKNDLSCSPYPNEIK
jgi:hypothetical protein